MKKEEFLELASQVFDQINPSENESKIVLEKNLFDEIADQISSDISDSGTGLISDYDLAIYSREIELESVDFSHREIESIVKSVLEGYFEIKQN